MILLPLSILRGRECLWDAEFLIAAAAGACLARIIPFIPISLQGQAGCGEAAAPQAPEMPPASPHLHQQSVPGAAASSPWHCRTPGLILERGSTGGILRAGLFLSLKGCSRLSCWNGRLNSAKKREMVPSIRASDCSGTTMPQEQFHCWHLQRWH